jgi:hypothetical protein
MFRNARFISIAVVAALGLVTLSACATPVASPAAEQPHTISVSGNGISYGKPDIAIAQVGVETRGPDPAQVVGDNTTKMNAVIAALKKLGIEDKDIQTSNFSVYAQQNYDADGKPTDYTYVADNIVSITVRDLSKVGDTLGQSVGAGANSINGVTFTVADQTALEGEARDKAMADAKARAEQLAKDAGVTLGAPMSISENSAVTPIPYSLNVRDVAGSAAAQAPVPVSGGQIQVNLQVNVTYTIK